MERCYVLFHHHHFLTSSNLDQGEVYNIMW